MRKPLRRKLLGGPGKRRYFDHKHPTNIYQQVHSLYKDQFGNGYGIPRMGGFIEKHVGLTAWEVAIHRFADRQALDLRYPEIGEVLEITDLSTNRVFSCQLVEWLVPRAMKSGLVYVKLL